MSSGAHRPTQTLCFIEPANAIRVIAESIGRDARRELVQLVVTAWVEMVPERELAAHYAKALAGLDDGHLQALAEWHEAATAAQPVASEEFLVGIFDTLGDRRREALALAAALRGADAFDAGVTETHVLRTVLPALAESSVHELAQRAVALYMRDRLGRRN
jgi:hypothetical protein